MLFEAKRGLFDQAIAKTPLDAPYDHGLRHRSMRDFAGAPVQLLQQDRVSRCDRESTKTGTVPRVLKGAKVRAAMVAGADSAICLSLARAAAGKELPLF